MNQDTFTDAETAALRAAGVNLDPPAPGVNEAVAAHTRAAYQALLDTALSVEQVGELLNISPAKVTQQTGHHMLHAITNNLHDWRYPAWQFNGEDILPGLRRILGVIPQGMHPLALSGYMHNPNADLEIAGKNVDPLTWLNDGGDPDVVVELAASLNYT